MNVGIIGCGYWGQNYVRIFSEMAEVTEVTISDLSVERLQHLKRHFPRVRTMQDYHGILTDPEIQAVIIATPTATHHGIALEALEAGKDVLVEKPMALSADEVLTLNQIADLKQRILMVGFTFGYHSAIRKMKKLIEEGDLGRIYYLTAMRTHLGLIREDVNVVWDLAPHDLFIFNHLLDMTPIRVTAQGSSYLNGHEDVAFITLTYPDNIIGHIQVSWMDAHKVREVVVVGSKKRLHFNDVENLEKIRISEKGASVEQPMTGFGEFQLQLRDGDILIPKIEAKEPLRVQCQHFLECLLTRRPPLTNGRAALDNVLALQAIDRSMREHGLPVEIPRPALVP